MSGSTWRSQEQKVCLCAMFADGLPLIEGQSVVFLPIKLMFVFNFQCFKSYNYTMCS